MHGSHKSKCHCELLAIRQPFFKMVSIIAFSNYVDVNQIYVNKIGQTYLVTRHISQVFALYKVESIITEEF